MKNCYEIWKLAKIETSHCRKVRHFVAKWAFPLIDFILRQSCAFAARSKPWHFGLDCMCEVAKLHYRCRLLQITSVPPKMSTWWEADSAASMNPTQMVGSKLNKFDTMTAEASSNFSVRQQHAGWKPHEDLEKRKKKTFISFWERWRSQTWGEKRTQLDTWE